MDHLKNIYLIFTAGYNIGVSRLVTPLGALSVATSIKNSKLYRKGDKVFICDTFDEVSRFAKLYEDERLYFLVSSVQIIRGVTIETNTALQYKNKLKEQFPNLCSVVGGPDVSLNPGSYIGNFDFVFQGEIGDLDILEIINSGRKHYIQNKPVDINAEIFDYRLLQGKKYLAGAIQTTRGCPFPCDFCNIGFMYGKQTRSICGDTLIKRFEALLEVHKGFVIISDDNFGGGVPEKAEQLLDIIIKFQIEHNYPFIFAIQASVNFSQYPSVMNKFRKSNVVAAFIGIESPSEDVLLSINKKHNVITTLEDQIDVFINYGIFPYVSLIVGLDNEPSDIVAHIKKFLEACSTPLMAVNMINPVIGSTFRENLITEGRLLNHEIYHEYRLPPLITKRNYVNVISDYIEILKWAFKSKRLLKFSNQIVLETGKWRDDIIVKEFMNGISWLFVAKAMLVYFLLCIKSKTYSGIILFFRLFFYSKADIIYSLVIRSVGIGVKLHVKKEIKTVTAGLKKLEEKGHYPYDQ